MSKGLLAQIRTARLTRAPFAVLALVLFVGRWALYIRLAFWAVEQSDRWGRADEDFFNELSPEWVGPASIYGLIALNLVLAAAACARLSDAGRRKLLGTGGIVVFEIFPTIMSYVIYRLDKDGDWYSRHYYTDVWAKTFIISEIAIVAALFLIGRLPSRRPDAVGT